MAVTATGGITALAEDAAGHIFALNGASTVLPLPGAELKRTIATCRRRSLDRGCDGRILR